MTEAWKQDRPKWCPHETCIFKRRAMDSICAGQLPTPVPHDGDENTHRLCINQAHDPEAIRSLIFDLQVNTNDLEWFRWIMDSIDGKLTSWLSRRQGQKPE